MARSTYIYVVMNVPDGILQGKTPVTAFTVRHELVSWLSSKSRSYSDYYIWRVSDGGHRDHPDDITEDIHTLVKALNPDIENPS